MNFALFQVSDLKRLDPAYGREFERRMNEARQRLVRSMIIMILITSRFFLGEYQ